MKVLIAALALAASAPALASGFNTRMAETVALGLTGQNELQNAVPLAHTLAYALDTASCTRDSVMSRLYLAQMARVEKAHPDADLVSLLNDAIKPNDTQALYGLSGGLSVSCETGVVKDAQGKAVWAP